MSYLAIARKYRPATFADMVGQEHVVRTLENALRSGRIHHAYLFCGARGVGKTTAARALAKALNCDQGPTPTPCGTCGSCVEISAGTSPDLVEIDGASNNSVEDVRELRETVNYAPTRGRYKVYLVDEVHMLSKAAFNALLKTLEEPPPHVVFIFATTEPNRILDTILSRVQRFDFKRIPLSATVERLGQIAAQEGLEVSEHALRMIARAGEGSMRDAQSLLDKVVSVSAADGAASDALVAETLGLVDRGLLLDFVGGLLRGDPAACLESIAQVYEYGHELSEFTAELLELLRHATFVRLSAEAARHVDLSEDEVVRLRELVEGVPVDVLTRTFHALLDVHDQVSRASRPRIVLEMAVARLATVRPVEPVSALLQRLEDLERRLRTQGAAPAQRSGQRNAFRDSPRTSRTPSPPRPTPPPVAIAPPPPAPPPPAPEPPRAQQPPARRPARQQRAPEPPPDDGPPPIEDGDLYVTAAEEEHEAPPPAADPVDAWDRLRPRLEELGHERLARAEATLRGTTLFLALPSGAPLARARRSRDVPEVQGLLRGAFPHVEAIELVPMAGTASPEEAMRALRKEALDDPDCKRIIARLGAELESVTSLRD
ncbi:MAG: DNA polymerase III subunit gamma/tau [Alphaproteobacteria bacterium]|nr:DNA polymerase III subunit gamma/tau [Alphaproteobacteria bacterium]